MNVAWIGLGCMGLPTAKKVAAAGHVVKAFDVAAPAPDKAEGLSIVNSAWEAAKDCDVLCIAVFSDAQVEDVLTGRDGVLATLKPGAIVAVFTTGAIDSIRALAATAPEGVAVLDTCFSNGHVGMAQGLITLLVGGDGEALERARPVFEAFSRLVFHIGGIGAGRAAKLVNNILLAGNIQMAADAMRLAEGLGLERVQTASALAECSGASDALRFFARPDAAAILEVNHRYMLKDVAAAAQAAGAAGVELGDLGQATAFYLKP